MKYLAAVLIFCVSSTFAQVITGEVELAGFVLGQPRANVYAELGPPIQKSKSDGWIYEFHKIKPDTSVYALFKYAKWDTTRVYSIQLSGKRYPEMHPIMGLRLGATKAEIDHALGTPSRVETETDPVMTLQYYESKNYSVDIDKNGKLFGIQIFGSILKNQPTSETPSIKGFQSAVLSKNADSLVHYLHPDIEIHTKGQILKYTGGARTEFRKTESEFTKHILGESESVWYVFAKERAEGSPHLQVHHESKEVTSIDKFFDSSVISEVMLKSHAGKWKVYQITFR
jgi:hypothetical protein